VRICEGNRGIRRVDLQAFGELKTSISYKLIENGGNHRGSRVYRRLKLGVLGTIPTNRPYAEPFNSLSKIRDAWHAIGLIERENVDLKGGKNQLKIRFNVCVWRRW